MSHSRSTDCITKSINSVGLNIANDIKSVDFALSIISLKLVYIFLFLKIISRRCFQSSSDTFDDFDNMKVEKLKLSKSADGSEEDWKQRRDIIF